MQYHGIETVTRQRGEPKCCVIDKDTLEGSEETESGRDVQKARRRDVEEMVDAKGVGVVPSCSDSAERLSLGSRYYSSTGTVAARSMLLAC